MKTRPDPHITFGVWAGASPAEKKNFNDGLKRLKDLNIRAFIPEEIQKNACRPWNKIHPFLAGPDEKKIHAFLKIVRQPLIRDIFCTRGGYGTFRLLPYLDKIDLSAFPAKRLWGYSDYTTLQHYLYFKYGWTWVHSPMLTGSSFQNPNRIEKSGWPQPFGTGSKTVHKLKIHHRPGFKSKKALLLGGNLATLVCLMGTRWEPRPSEKYFLFIEDVSEAGRFVDRYLHQLHYSHFFENCIGILTGHFTDSPGAQKIFEDFCRVKRIPYLSGLLAGHESPNIPIPMGLDVELSLGAKNSAELRVPELTFGW